MRDERKTKAQLINELAELRQRVAEVGAAEAERVRSEKRMVNILESISDGFFTLDDDLVVTYFNQAAEQLLGRGSEEVLGRKLFETFPEARGSIFEEKYTWAVKERAFTSFETYFSVKPYENWYEVRVYPYEDGISVYFRVTTERVRAESQSTLHRAQSTLHRAQRDAALEELKKYRDHLEELVEERTAELAKANKQLQREITERRRAEEALRISEEGFSKAFHSSPSIMAISTLKDGRYIDVNESFSRTTGYSREEAIGRTSTELRLFTNPEDRERLAQMLEERRAIHNVEVGVRVKTGAVRIGLFSAELVEVEGERCLLTVMDDITERVRMESEKDAALEALRESEHHLKTILDTVQAGIVIVDAETREVVEANPAALQMIGASKGEVIGSLCHRFICPTEQGQCPVCDLGQREDNSERTVLKISGEELPVIKTVVPVMLGGRKRLLESFVDIAERVQAESRRDAALSQREAALEELRESEEKFRNLAEQSPNMIFINHKGRIVYANERCEEVTGYTREEFYSPDFDFLTLIAPDSIDLVKASFSRHMEGEDVSPYEYTLVSKEGERIETILASKLIRYEGGSAILGMTTDITEHKQAEEALRESEAKYRELVESANSIIFRMDTQGRVTFFNEFAHSFFGYTEDEILGRDVVGTLVPERDSSGRDLAGMIQDILEDPEKYANNENENVRRNGERVWVAWTNKAIRDGSGRLTEVLCVGNDITERVQAEDLIRAKRDLALKLGAAVGLDETLRLCVEAAIHSTEMDAGGVYLVDEVSGDLNLAYSKGLSPDFVKAISHYDADSPTARLVMAGKAVYINYLELNVPLDETRRREGLHVIAILPVHHEGQVIACLNITSRSLDEISVAVRDTLETVAAQIGSFVARARAESQREAALEALWESNLRLEETLAELEATQEQIVQQERLAAVGQLAAGVAHDFNNLLTSIMGYAELVRMSPDIPSTAQADLANIVKQGRRAAHLVRQILDFSRKTIRQPQPLDLVPFLKEAVKFLERTIPESVHITLEIEPLECLIQADPTQLQQMVTNLAVNARDAMPAGGELKLRLSSLMLRPGEPPPCPELPPGEWGVLSVSDTGTGIPAEVLPHIFEPFFTTRAPEGSGLGLAQVYGIVKQHEGAIDVESQVGKGATFTIYLPALVAGEQAPPRETAEDLPRGQGETILLVEDEPAVLEVSQALLERLGYRVLTAADGQQALEVYGEHQGEIALILADIVMPKMDGLTLFHVLKAQSPDVKVVLISGYPLGEEAQRVLDQGIADWLQKPMTLTQLAQVVSRALGR